jgi:hypothetical protein
VRPINAAEPTSNAPDAAPAMSEGRLFALTYPYTPKAIVSRPKTRK